MLRLFIAACALAVMLTIGGFGGRAFAQSSSNGAYGGFVGSSEWFHDMMEHAQNQANLRHNLPGRSGGGPCAKAPAGWAVVNVLITFPAEYGGYAQSVNSAALVPAGDNLPEYLKGESQPGVSWSLALQAGPEKVRTSLCAMSGRQYWMTTDSGFRGGRVAIASLKLGRGAGPYYFKATAPPLHHAATAQPLHHTLAATSPHRTVTEVRPRVAEPWAFDLAGLPRPPQNFDEQLVLSAIDTAQRYRSPATQADAHQRLANYYRQHGDPARASEEQARADYWRAGGH